MDAEQPYASSGELSSQIHVKYTRLSERYINEMSSRRELAALAIVSCLLLVLQLPSVAGLSASDAKGSEHSAGADVSQSAAGFNHCSTAGTTVNFITQSDLTGDVIINQGQSVIISGRVLNMRSFNFIVNGGVLIINSSVLRGYASAWQVQRGACAEVTNSFDYVSADSINVGGNPPPLQSSPDGSSLFVNHSTMLPGIMITGRDVMVKIVDSVFQDNVFFNEWVTNWPVEPSETKAFITNTIVPTLALAFGGPNQGADISNLRAGHFGYWNLHQNLTVYNVPYDLTLSNVTLIPNSGGEGNLLGGGWGLQFTPGGSYGMYWPYVSVTNSQIGQLAFFWYGAQIPSGSFSNLGLRYPTTQTVFDTVKFVNTTVEGFIDVGCNSCTLTFNNVRGLGIFVGGKTNVTLVNSWTDDSFQPQGCFCRVTFSGNSSLGRNHLIPFTTLPYYRDLPNASWWQALGGVSFITNSNVIISGNYTDRLVGPGFPVQGSNLFWSNSMATRTYPVIVLDQSSRPVASAEVTLTSASGVARHYTTRSNGRVDISLHFTNVNFTRELPISAALGQEFGSAQLGLASTTPFVITTSPLAVTTTSTKSSTTTSSSSTTVISSSSTTATSTSSQPATSTTTEPARSTSNSSTATASITTTTRAASSQQDLAPYLVAASATAIAGGLVVIGLVRRKRTSS